MKNIVVSKALASLGLSFFCAALMVSTDGIHQDAEAADNRPDVILLMDDDRGRVNNNRLINRQPNLRALYNRSMVLEASDQVPVCGPSRAGLLTGQYPAQHGVNYNKQGGNLNMSRTFLRVVRNQGVHVSVVGKLINEQNKAAIRRVTDDAALFYSSYEGGGVRLKNKAVEFVKNAPKDKPQLLLILPTAPHSKSGSHLPYVEKRFRGIARCQGIGKFRPPTYDGRYNPNYPFNMPKGVRKGWPLRKICEALSPVDVAIKAVLAEQKSRSRSVITIYMTDNGMSYGAFNHAHKANPYSMRNDILVSGPGIKPGKVSMKKLISTMDVGVTIADIYGGNMTWAKGRSFLSLLKGQGYNSRNALYECFPHPNPRISFVARRFFYKGEVYRIIRYGNGRTRLTQPSKQPYEWTDYKNKRPKWLTKKNRSKVKYWAKNNCARAL